MMSVTVQHFDSLCFTLICHLLNLQSWKEPFCYINPAGIFDVNISTVFIRCRKSSNKRWNIDVEISTSNQRWNFTKVWLCPLGSIIKIYNFLCRNASWIFLNFNVIVVSVTVAKNIESSRVFDLSYTNNYTRVSYLKLIGIICINYYHFSKYSTMINRSRQQNLKSQGRRVYKALYP